MVQEERKIIVRGARAHNLKNISLVLPHHKLIVFTGISGSGKSTLAFDTLFAEGQRRYLESLSTYARQFLSQLEKPEVDFIEGLSPAVSISQKEVSKNPRSTVGTATEIYDYLRVLFARIGKPYCPSCSLPISRITVDQINEGLQSKKGHEIIIFSPVVKGRKGEYSQLLERLGQEGYTKVRIDGRIHRLGQKRELSRYRLHDIEVVVDELVIKGENKGRIAESLETALKLGEGIVIVKDKTSKKEMTFSSELACPQCGFSFPEISPRIFSFNSPYGACPSCEGIGTRKEIDISLVVPNPNLSLAEGAVLPQSYNSSTYYHSLIRAAANCFDIPLHKPLKSLSSEEQKILLYGPPKEELVPVRFWSGGKVKYFQIYFRGIIENLLSRYQRTSSDSVREEIERYMSTLSCTTCKGSRLKKESLSIRIGGRNIAEISAMSIKEAREFFEKLDLIPRERIIARRLTKEIKNRLDFLKDVGLDYLTLDRSATTLAAGESQRIRLASQLGAKLVGVLYVLDEPSVGLHQRDNAKLIATLEALRDQGNTIIVVEHDRETICHADFVVDLGPGAGKEGGEIVASGTLPEVINTNHSLTFQYLRGEIEIEIPEKRQKPKGKFLTIVEARQHNLKGITVKIPLGLFVCITGVSGSGKSTLVEEILYKELARRLHGSLERPGLFKEIKGVEGIDKVIIIDQSPIGRTPRSNPVTYTGAFDHIRKLFSLTTEARMRGYLPGRFSFNVPGGRSEACRGEGMTRVEMHFLPDIYISCEVWGGFRFNKETLGVRYKGKNISEVLKMTMAEALDFFRGHYKITYILQTIADVGLNYIDLGQPATTLSGGEAQRIKLAAELSRKATGRTLYILDEPTTGLHFHDIRKLLEVLQRLVNLGNTVIVIEHNPDVIKVADYIIDLGPEGGELGGEVVAEGTPEEIAQNPKSYTGQFLRKLLQFESS